ncbi:MAG: uncharacterized protein KVP18_001757 [Porospora cf. gigantea A]|uniref:uncharacterized protein n=1 Tax=Porospora cf. gigantea A TaxID=2853593 RepID=UPI0035594B20|nr:MAG: hypothetical protein KVP18_001757 [Porospora cf. gigantea A]
MRNSMAEVTTLHRQRDESSKVVEQRGFCLILASFLAQESDDIDFSQGPASGEPVSSNLTTFPKRQNGSHYFSSTSRAILLRLFSEEAIDIRSLSGPDSSCLQFDVRMLSLHQLLWLRVKYQKYYVLLTRANHDPQVRLLESVESTLLEGLANVKATPNDRRLLGLEMIRAVSQQLAIGGSHIWRLFAKNGEIKVASEARESKFSRQPSAKGSIRSRSLSRAPAYASAGLEVFLELPAHNVSLVRPSDTPVALVVDVGTSGNANRVQWDVLEVNASVTK